jgi:hypothetical protein
VIPPEVIKEDRDLDLIAENATERLMELRWHWTLDESNSSRVSITEYARQVGVYHNAVVEHARGWELKIARQLKLSDDLDRDRTPGDYAKLASMTQERADIVDAVAQAEGISVSRAKDSRQDDISRVRDAVAELMDREPAATREDRQEIAQRTARNISVSRKIGREQRDKLLQSQPHLLTELQGELAKAREALIAARSLARDADRSVLPGDALSHLDSALLEISGFSSDIRVLLGTVNWDARLV